MASSGNRGLEVKQEVLRRVRALLDEQPCPVHVGRGVVVGTNRYLLSAELPIPANITHPNTLVNRALTCAIHTPLYICTCLGLQRLEAD